MNEIIPESVREVARLFSGYGGKALLVGGSVRDMILHIDPKDFDIEVYGLEASKIEELAQNLGKVSAVGKAFGILKVDFAGISLDISLPRVDSKIGVGHRGFEAKTDPYMTIEEAAKRRDFTINSMALDPLTDQLYDPFNGLKDLENGILRVTDSERFKDDPLRIMRGLQFAARFNLTVEEGSFKIMQGEVTRLKELPRERLLEEWEKLLTKAKKPSIGLNLSSSLGVFDILHPEFSLLSKTPQQPGFHPEGDVLTHTKLTTDAAAAIIRRQELDSDSAFTMMLAALCHDLGKPATTKVYPEGKVTAHGHAEAGVGPTRSFLDTINAKNVVKDKVLKLVEYHMWPHNMFRIVEQGQKVSGGTFRKLARSLYPATILELAMLAEVDCAGRGQLSLPKLFPEGDWLREGGLEAEVLSNEPRDIIQGRDLIALGYTPGKAVGEMIRLANTLHDDQGYSKEELLDKFRPLTP